MRHTSPHTARFPKHSVDTAGSIKLGIFGEVKADCTKQTLELGLGTGPPVSTTGSYSTAIPIRSIPINKQDEHTKTFMEKNAPFFSLHTKKLLVYCILMSETRSGSS